MKTKIDSRLIFLLFLWKYVLKRIRQIMRNNLMFSFGSHAHLLWIQSVKSRPSLLPSNFGEVGLTEMGWIHNFSGIIQVGKLDNFSVESSSLHLFFFGCTSMCSLKLKYSEKNGSTTSNSLSRIEWFLHFFLLKRMVVLLYLMC